jgi:pilus assembly protein FimV
MLRKSAFILTMLLCSLVTQVLAQELGTISVESNSNQTLRARIEILQLGGTRWQDITVQMASADDFERFNIERVPFLTNIRFSVESTTQGNYVNLTSDQIVSEPNLTFVLETRWPSGGSLSVHTVLLDSPVFQDDQVEEVRAPISPILQPPVDAQPAQSSINQTLELASEEPEPVLELEPVEPETITTSDADTLSDIAERVRPNTSVSIQQTMLAIQELNPNAFIDGNINQMRSGQVLRIPALGEVQAINAREAIDEVNLQNQQITDVQPFVPSAQEELEEDDQPQGQLSVVTEAPSAGDLGSAAGGIDEQESAELDRRIAQLENQLALRQEEADRASIERAELDSRLADLESQIDAAQEIIRLQDLQLAQLQDQLAEAAAAQAEAAEAATAALAAIEVEVTVDPQPTSGNGLMNDLMRILTGNTLTMILGLTLVILLLVAILLRRNKATGPDDEDLDELAEKEFPSDAENGGEEAADGDPDTQIDEFIHDDNKRAEAKVEIDEDIQDEDNPDDLGFLSDDDEVEIESVVEVEEADLLSDDDETATKLELAYAYQKMGDIEGAKEILQEVIKEGADEQVKEAEELIASLDKLS